MSDFDHVFAEPNSAAHGGLLDSAIESYQHDEADETTYDQAYDKFIIERTAYHLTHPDERDLDQRLYEEGFVNTFLRRGSNDPLDGALMLMREAHFIAKGFAEDDAQEAERTKIMEAL
jgi:hypothetical protein